MIRLWLARDNAIPIREQLSAQLLLGILSRRIPPGERLPSVRDLARRLKVHANTVSAVYRDLAARGWVTNRKGSGVYVRASMPGPSESLDTFVHTWIDAAAAHGFTPIQLHAALAAVIQNPARRLLVVHPDPDLAAILAAEIEEALGQPVPFATPRDASLTPDTCVLTTAATAEQIAGRHPAASEIIRLKPLGDVIAGQARRSIPPLIAIVSRSVTIHQWSSTLISALGFSETNVIQRNPADKGWQQGLAACDLVAADVKAAGELPAGIAPVVFRIVAGEFLEHVRTLTTAVT